MKNIRKTMDRYFDKLDERWQAFPLRKQRQYTLYLFIGYLLFTAAVVLKTWYDAETPDTDKVVDHIENPVLKREEHPAHKQDTLSINHLKK